MNKLAISLTLTAALALASCGESANGQSASSPDETSLVREVNIQEFDAISGTYITDPEHRYITFTYSHLGYSTPYLRWRDWTGTLDWDADAPENSSITVTIDVNSIDSGVDRFDDHLRSDDWFDADVHPEITFVSTSVERTGDATGKITGDLTIKGITKPLILDAVFNKAAYEDRAKAFKLGFSATGTVKRSDYGVDAYTPFVPDEVELIIETEFVMPAAQ